MADHLFVIGRILIQGPQVPLPGDSLDLSVYLYLVLKSDGSPAIGEQIEVAHRQADFRDPGFAVGSTRRLELSREVPRRGTLLFAQGGHRPDRIVWYCPNSTGISTAGPQDSP